MIWLLHILHHIYVTSNADAIDAMLYVFIE